MSGRFPRAWAAKLAEDQDKRRRDEAINKAWDVIEPMRGGSARAFAGLPESSRTDEGAGPLSTVALTENGEHGNRRVGIASGSLTLRPPIDSSNGRLPRPSSVAGAPKSKEKGKPGAGRAFRKGQATLAPLVAICRAAGLPVPSPEYRFDEKRRFRFDYAWPTVKLGLEVEGGVWRGYGKAGAGGAHSHPVNIERDIEKYNLAALAGWRVLRYAPEDLTSKALPDLLAYFAASSLNG